MKYKILLLLSAVLLGFQNVDAQQKLKFKTANLAGLVAGASKPAFQMQSVNGLSYRDFFAGIGVGMDNYYFKSIPLFLHLERNVLSKKATPFLYTDIGVNFPEDRYKNENTWQTSKYDMGYYFDLGIGYSAPLYKKLLFNVSVGYSHKQMEEKRTVRSQTWSRFPDVIYENSEHYAYTFRRISLKVGVSF